MERVGFCGLGTMGGAMAANLRRAEFLLTVWNRSPGRATPLLELGAAEAASPRAVAEASDVVVICVSDSPDVEAVLFGPDGVAEGARAMAMDDRDAAGSGRGRSVDIAVEQLHRLVHAGPSEVEAARYQARRSLGRR